MNVQVILRDGEPEYAVLPWAEYQALRAAAGHKGEVLTAVAQPAQIDSEKPSLGSLRVLREARNVATEDLARAAGISPAYLAMIESGERQPGAAIKRSLAMNLGVSGWSDEA